MEYIILAKIAKVLENALKALYFNNVVQQKWFVFNNHLYKVSFYLGKSILN